MSCNRNRKKTKKCSHIDIDQFNGLLCGINILICKTIGHNL